MKMSNTKKIPIQSQFCLIVLFLITAFPAGASIDTNNWWPSQSPPQKIVKLSELRNLAEKNLAQSVCGLAAAAVNDQKHDELIWIDTQNSKYASQIDFKNSEYVRLFDKTTQALGITNVRTLDLWQLLAEYKNKQIIKGYILYTLEDEDAGPDASVNTATTMAGFEQAMIVERSLESAVQAMGFTQLADANKQTMQECFERYREKANRNMIAAIPPELPYMRDMAIAHKCFTIYGTHEIVSEMMEWLNPLSVVIGWNKGDEMKHVGLASQWGHFETASDYCINLPVIASAATRLKCTPVDHLKPWEIDFSQGQDFVSFLFSDGDNIQWTMGGFCQGPTLWKSPLHGTFPMTWTTCSAHLAQVSPETFSDMARTKPASSSFVEFSGGYFYPDTFASSRANRPEILRQHAQKLSAQLQKSGVNIVCAIFNKVNSKAAKEAYQIFAREIEDIIGIVAIQYAPYDGGDGRVFWYPNKDGIDIPIIAVKYSLWERARWERGGEYEKIASLVKDYAQKTDEKTFSIVINHAWSQYKRPKKPSEKVTGLEPVKWLYDEIHKDVSVVNMEELIWRTRMEHAPKQTGQAIEAMKRSTPSGLQN